MRTISREEYSKLQKDSIELQKLKMSVSKLTEIIKEKSKIIKNLRDSVSYYKKLSEKSCTNLSVSILPYNILLYSGLLFQLFFTAPHRT